MMIGVNHSIISQNSIIRNLLHVLNFTKTLAASRFNEQALRVMELDALQIAVLRLKNSPKTPQITTELLISTANSLLPDSNNPDGVRLFFATSRQEQDAPFDSLQNFGQFILSQIRHFEELIAISAQKDDSGALAQLDLIIDDLVLTYSYIIDACYGLRAQGLIPSRRNQDLRELANYSAGNASIFDRAFAMHEKRISDELSSGESPGYQ
jgi:hypothetical protein